MAFNGSGTFVRLYNWVNDAAANIKIRADRMDAEMDGFATGLSTAITKNGQTTITANLPMSTYRHTGVGAAVNRTDYARTGEVQDGSINWVDGGGTADAITAAYSIPLTALVDGQLCYVRATAANATTTPTFSPSGLTARTIVKNGGQALVAGDIAGDGHELVLRYLLASTRWELLNPSGAGFVTPAGTNTFTATNTFTGKVLYPDDGELTIATGAITVTGVYHTIDTEADAATDDLDTINGGADGQILYLRTEADARDVTLTTAGNIETGRGKVILENSSRQVQLIYDGEKSKWMLQNNQKRLVNIQYFSADGTYTPTAGVTEIDVEAYGSGGGGGGGGGGTNGGNGGAGGDVVFSGYSLTLTASGGGLGLGGGSGATGAHGADGTGTNGDHNISGGGMKGGFGGTPTGDNEAGSCGGFGGFLSKLGIDVSGGATATITVGAAGTAGTAGSGAGAGMAGAKGYVKVYEYQ